MACARRGRRAQAVATLTEQRLRAGQRLNGQRLKKQRPRGRRVTDPNWLNDPASVAPRLSVAVVSDLYKRRSASRSVGYKRLKRLRVRIACAEVPSQRAQRRGERGSRGVQSLRSLRPFAPESRQRLKRELLNEASVAVQSLIKVQVRGGALAGQRLKRLKVPIYEDIRVCACTSYIEGFSRFSRCLVRSNALTCCFPETHNSYRTSDGRCALYFSSWPLLQASIDTAVTLFRMYSTTSASPFASLCPSLSRFGRCQGG
ncbi:hypothetical protein SAMN05446589_9520 [Streptomyces sp. OV198]|nr:hypothetical protein SAMN05446589_9520 [Streptomyces sp. OV198]